MLASPAPIRSRLPRRLLSLLALAVVACAAPVPSPADADTIIKAPRGDPELARAAERAQATWSEFAAKTFPPAPGTHGHTVKIALRVGDVIEWVWIGELKGSDNGLISGVLMNEPVDVDGYTIGQPMTASQDEIVDWMYFAGDRAVGGYSVCVLAKRDPGGRRIVEGLHLRCP